MRLDIGNHGRALLLGLSLCAGGAAGAQVLDAGTLAAEATIIRVARLVTPAVVSVSTPNVGAGSGVIIRADGVILTNAHVVGNARNVEIGLADGRRVPGRVLGRDARVDIAVVRVALRGLPAALVGNSDALEVGQTAIAIGNPVGLERTVTTGIISAVNRSPRGFELGGLIQTDAAINPGNSGGPLLDSQGRVIGINSAILRGTTGLGFAIPINLAQNIAEQLITTGRITRAYLGITPVELEPEIVARFDLPVREGVIVRTVGQGSPAARAGFRPGDIITGVDDQPVRTVGELLTILRNRSPGESVRVTVARLDNSGRSAPRLTLSARLAAQPVP